MGQGWGHCCLLPPWGAGVWSLPFEMFSNKFLFMNLKNPDSGKKKKVLGQFFQTKRLALMTLICCLYPYHNIWYHP